jgi:1-piperideine-2-carboxylate/1-pyrroline-2-carboxylate reductase [NAD(P)H]
MIDIGARRTEQLLPYGALVDEILHVIQRNREGAVQWIERNGITLASGTSVWSMIAADEEIAVNKTVTINPANAALGRTTVGGQVAVFDTTCGAPLMVLDGPALTARRTAAVSSLAVRALRGDARSALVVGSGVSARAHVECLAEQNGIRMFYLYGRNPGTVNRLAQFARGLGVECLVASDMAEVAGKVDVVVTATSSAAPVLSGTAWNRQLIVAVGAYQAGMAELSANIVQSAEAIVVDHLEAAQREAGDLIQAEVDWSRVRVLEDVLTDPLPNHCGRHRIFKSVGHSLWDLAAARVARRRMGSAK